VFALPRPKIAASDHPYDDTHCWQISRAVKLKSWRATMKKSTPGDDWPPLPPRPRPGHRYHMVSIVMPFLGLSLAIGFLSLTPSFGGLNQGRE
jgi:hypothetical protein